MTRFELDCEYLEQQPYCIDLCVDFRPSKLSQLENDTGFITVDDVTFTNLSGEVTDNEKLSIVLSELDGKIEAVDNKVDALKYGRTVQYLQENNILTLKDQNGDILSSTEIVSGRGASSFEELEGDPYDNANLKTALDAKANTSDIEDIADEIDDINEHLQDVDDSLGQAVDDIQDIKDEIDTYGTIVTHNEGDYYPSNNPDGYQNSTQVTSAIESSIINNVTSTATNKSLSANMGKALSDRIAGIEQKDPIVDVGNGQFMHEGFVLPLITVDLAKTIYNKFTNGEPVILKWELYGTFNYLNVISADINSGIYSLDVLVHNKYHLAYTWQVNDTGNVTTEVVDKLSELKALTGYSATGTLTLKSVNGVLQWVAG